MTCRQNNIYKIKNAYFSLYIINFNPDFQNLDFFYQVIVILLIPFLLVQNTNILGDNTKQALNRSFYFYTIDFINMFMISGCKCNAVMQYSKVCSGHAQISLCKRIIPGELSHKRSITNFFLVWYTKTVYDPKD